MPDEKTFDTLAAALADFQAHLPTVAKGATGQVGQNRNYKYADLGDLNQKVLPELGRRGLSFSCRPTLNEHGRFVLAYALRHVSGGEDVGEWPLPEDATPQQIGSATTYARRYALQAVSGVAPDEDDDGATAGTYEHRTTPRQQQRPTQHNRQQRSSSAPPVNRDAGPPAGGDTVASLLETLRARCTRQGYNDRAVADLYSAENGVYLKDETDVERLRSFMNGLDARPTKDLAPPVPATNGAAQ